MEEFSFSRDEIVEPLKNLTAAQVEYIEISYFKGSFKPMDNVDQKHL